MLLKNICDSLEQWAPLSYQETYDNSGLIVGDKQAEISGVLVSLDCVEEVVDEAIACGCNLIVSHHPIVFKGLKSLTGKNYVERTLLKAIKNDIAIYAIHTNLDNVNTGVNWKIAEVLGLQNVRILAPKSGGLKQLVTYVPTDQAANLKDALFKAGAGTMGEYSECSFSATGKGTFRGSELSNPQVGIKGERTELKEERIELVFPAFIETKVLNALKVAHPYEEVAYGIFALENQNQFVGSGLIAELPEAMDSYDFLRLVKKKMKTECVRHTNIHAEKVKKIALCGGAGSFLLGSAKRAGADVFITGDFKYHEFFDAENQILIADIGHYESEQFTIELISDFLSKNFPKFAVRLSKVNTNPINYL